MTNQLRPGIVEVADDRRRVSFYGGIFDNAQSLHPFLPICQTAKPRLRIGEHNCTYCHTGIRLEFNRKRFSGGAGNLDSNMCRTGQSVIHSRAAGRDATVFVLVSRAKNHITAAVHKLPTQRISDAGRPHLERAETLLPLGFPFSRVRRRWKLMWKDDKPFEMRFKKVTNRIFGLRRPPQIALINPKQTWIETGRGLCLRYGENSEPGRIDIDVSRQRR